MSLLGLRVPSGRLYRTQVSIVKHRAPFVCCNVVVGVKLGRACKLTMLSANELVWSRKEETNYKPDSETSELMSFKYPSCSILFLVRFFFVSTSVTVVRSAPRVLL